MDAVIKENEELKKQKTARDLGYNYEIWIYDYKGNCVEKFT
jgi:hypothetical protein